MSLICFYIPSASQACKDRLHVKAATEKIFEDGGEGIVIRKKGSSYVPGRSDVMYKFKVFDYVSSFLLFFFSFYIYLVIFVRY